MRPARATRRLVVATPLMACVIVAGARLGADSGADPSIATFFSAASEDAKVARAALDDLATAWRDGYAAMLIDMARLMPGPRRGQTAGPDETASLSFDDDRNAAPKDRPDDGLTAPVDRGSPARRRLIAFLEKQTRERFGDDLTRWRQWIWALPYRPHPDYPTFKSLLYGRLDARMRDFFPDGVSSTIRLDEIDWGGVRVNGIPPLRYPKFVAANAAVYLKDSHIVFGLVVNGEAKAYPRRILAWHEMATDRIGGIEMTIVYCTLCGTVIPFESRAGGQTFVFGTSGLLYRSNKLMFDEQTSSLWSTFEGVPVVGALVGSGVTLTTHPVVTTTWKEWRTEHPETRVLALDTGYERDYSEGAAYRDYFATDRLMFHVSNTDGRLRNKAEVLVMQLQSPSGVLVPVAIDTKLLNRRRVFAFAAAERRFIVLTTAGGANRVYEVNAEFEQQPLRESIVDAAGRTWRVTEAALVLEGSPAERRPRISAQRAFWFGWFAQFPRTLLLQ